MDQNVPAKPGRMLWIDAWLGFIGQGLMQKNMPQSMQARGKAKKGTRWVGKVRPAGTKILRDMGQWRFASGQPR